MSMEYRDHITDTTTKDIWLCSAANDFSHLAQGLPDKCVDPTNTIFFIPLTNNQPAHVSSAAIALKKPNISVHV